MRVCIVGDSGLLGQALVDFFSAKKDDVLGVSSGRFPEGKARASFIHESMDLSASPDAFEKRVRNFRPDLLVNAAALVDLAECEKNPDLARRVNTGIAAHLAAFSARERIGFAHISTDQIFDGKKDSPYSEEDTPFPLNVYGKTKLEAEREVRRLNPSALTVRTNIVGFRGRAEKPTFAEWLCRALAEKEKITLADDFVTSSLHVNFLSGFISTAFQSKLSGIYHFASRDGVSKHRFAELLAAEMGVDLSAAVRGKLKDLKLFPPRPAYLALDVSRAERTLNVRFPETKQTAKLLAEDFHNLRAGSDAKILKRS